jgi:pimeloyl-ACP methyl ester carboxylesterase
VTRGGSAGALALVLLVAACTPDPGADPEPEQTPETTATAEPAEEEAVDGPLGQFYSQQLTWEPCDEFECATLDVPLDYDDPEGGTIELAVLRVAASDDDPIGSLLVNPGGPGSSGINYARSGQVVTDDVHRRYDIVGFDPRGVGESAPIDCVDDEELDRLVALDGAPSDGAELETLREAYRTFIEGCGQRSGELLPHVATTNVVMDMDILRAALGDSSLHYLGKSYGTFIGTHYAAMFPERVGRVVLDGAIDPALDGQDFALGQAIGIEQALAAYVSWCVEQAECPLGPNDRVARDTLAALLEVIADDPLPTDDPSRPLTQPLAMLGVLLPLYLPPEQGYEVLTAALTEAQAGNGSVLLYLADIYLERNEDGSYASNQVEAFNAVHCVDRPSETDPAAIEQSLAEFEELSPTFGPFLAWGGLVCEQWPVEPVITPAPVSAAGADPILVVGMTGDLATPYEWAESLAAQLDSGVLLTYDGFGHLTYLSAGSECVDSAVDAYLLDGELPDESEICS